MVGYMYVSEWMLELIVTCLFSIKYYCISNFTIDGSSPHGSALLRVFIYVNSSDGLLPFIRLFDFNLQWIAF